MQDFMAAGGAPMWAILVFGAMDLVLAILFAWRPERSRVPAIGALSLAVLFSVGSGVMADLAAVGTKVPNRPEWANSPKVHLIILQGFAESMAPGVLGFSLLSLVAFVCAVGLRRMARP
jgi:hypothetical protein